MPHTYSGSEQLFDLRERVRKGEPVSPEEYGKIITALREERGKKPAAKPRAKKASSNLPTDLSGMLDKPVAD